MLFSAFWGLNWGQKSLFFIRYNVAFIQLSIYQSQSIPTSNEQMMKTKLATFARKQILRKQETCEKLTEI